MAFPYRVPPMAHQLAAMKKAWGKPAFALFHDMGVGKTFTTINLFGGYFRSDLIDAVVVVCPTPIKLVWDLEVGKMSPVDADVHVLVSGDRKVESYMHATSIDRRLKYLVVGVEALSSGGAFKTTLEFMEKHRCAMVVDESSKIKNPSASRTKKVIKLGEKALYRMALTGTPVTQGLEDLYSQFRYLDSDIVGCQSYFVFKNKYCMLGGFENRAIVGYQNKEDLIERIKPYVDVVKSEDVLDLPEKTYGKIIVALSKEQKVALKSLKDLYEAESEGDLLTVATVLARVTRYQQIIGGNFPFNDFDNGGYKSKPIEGKSPKLEALLDSIGPVDKSRKIIIWARFRPEVAAISNRLAKEYGAGSVVEFHGGVDTACRKEAIQKFQEDPKVRFFVVNQQTGAMGITLTAANLVYYFSNSFSYEDRVQSEKRNHRKGQSNSCHYIDIIAEVNEDKMILSAVQKKGGLAKYVEEEMVK